MSSSQPTASLLVQSGLESLEAEFQEVLDCFREVLLSSSRPALAEALDGDATTLDLGDAAQVSSIAFQLLDMVEERVANETRQRRMVELGPAAEKGLWAHCLESLKREGVSEEKIAGAFHTVRIEPVFTAHPTEAKRPSVRERHRDIFELLCQFRDANLPEKERSRLREDFVTALEALWHTGEIHVEKPTIERELRNVLYYLREVFPSTVETLTARLQTAWEEAGFSPETLRDAGDGPKIRFGLWIGGDRDGHPFVTAEVTRNTLQQLREQAIKLYRAELADIAGHLSVTIPEAKIPPSLQERISELVSLLGDVGQEMVTRNPGEPWRAACYLVRAHLLSTSPPSCAAFRQDIELLGSSLEEIGAHRLRERFVRPLLHKLSVFGLHLADLDIRQNSGFHDKAAAQLLEASHIPDGADFPNWSEERRVAFLTEELTSNRPFLHWDQPVAPEADAVRDCFRVFAEYRGQYGEGLGALIVSMTRQLSDLLLVHLFAREAGLSELRGDVLVCPLQVVPLFETLDDLKHAPSIVDAYLSHPVAQRSIDGSQQIMLGYSDSNKDGGILASQWGLHEAQLAITSVARKHDVSIRFFHGRGGSVSRGAGPTNWFLRALPHGSLHGDFRMTEQGETIAQKYAYPENAAYHLESTAACVTRTTVIHSETVAKEDPGLSFISSLADKSRDTYRALLEADDFITFYRQATPIDALEKTQLGSRPSRRTGTASLADLRAIPWVFSWTQSRFYLPGWFGVGTALNALAEEQPDEFSHLAAVIGQSTLPRYIFTSVETNLLSTDLDLMHGYASLVEDEAIRARFMERIEAEWNLTQKHLHALFPEPVELRRPRYAKTLEARAAPLRRLHLQQIDQLRTWRSQGAELPRELILSISAVASGLRTTG